MCKLTLQPITTPEEKQMFIEEIQEAFQRAYVAEFGPFEPVVLPEADIEDSFQAEGAEAYLAEVDGRRVGGTVIVVEPERQFASLHLLYVRTDAQNGGFGRKLWQAIEKLHPEVKIWETHTPYYDKRNIHFYVNRCGFHIVEFFNEKHEDPHQVGETSGNIPPEHNYFFRFEKVLP